MNQMDAMDDASFAAWLEAEANFHREQAHSAEANALPNVVPDVDLTEMSVVPSASAEPQRKRARVAKPIVRGTQHVELYETQQEHVQRIDAMFAQFPFALDFSMLGAGKTYTSTYLAMKRGYKHVIVICPVSVIPKWKQMQRTFDVPIRQIMGFQALRSTKFHQPKHGYLHRRDYKHTVTTQHPHLRHPMFQRTEVIDKVDFKITDEYQAMVDEGLLLIIDEMQNIKNISSQFHAAQALIHAITLKNGELSQLWKRPSKGFFSFLKREPDDVPQHEFKSHVLLLSGSPIDKQPQAVHIFRALGIMTDDRIAQMNIQTGVVDWRGMQQIEDFCRAIDPTATSATPRQYGFEPTLDGYAYRLFQNVFKRHFSSSMPPPKPKAVLHKRNAYYAIDAEGAEICARGLTGLKTATQFDGNNVNFAGGIGAAAGSAGRALCGVTRSLQIIETGKIKLFARVAREHLTKNPMSKVCIAVNFSDTVTDLQTLLADFQPLILTGSCSEIQRGKVMDQFQAHTLERRLLICNQSVASTGIDLDDKHGAFPRLALVSPNYSSIMSYQLGHRFQRADTKSDAQVHFVFAKRKGQTKEACADIIELRVLDALSRKSQVMKETTAEQAKAGVIFPGEHTEWHEDGVAPVSATHTQLTALQRRRLVSNATKKVPVDHLQLDSDLE